MTAATAGGKLCARCQDWKPLDAFSQHPAGPMGRRSSCRDCESQREKDRHSANPDKRRGRTLRHRYGLDHEQYLALVAEQDGRCAICRTDSNPVRNAKGERYWLHIDHDHETGEIRGLLCTNCNNGIGHLRHDPLVLHMAIEYLERRR